MKCEGWPSSFFLPLVAIQKVLPFAFAFRLLIRVHPSIRLIRVRLLPFHLRSSAFICGFAFAFDFILHIL